MLEFKQQRNAEFYRTCKKLINRSGGTETLRQITGRAVREPATSFFISENRIARIIRSGGEACPRSEAKAALFHAIKHLYFELKTVHPEMSPEAIAGNIIFYRQAPRFYISEATALNIYYSELDRRKKQIGK